MDYKVITNDGEEFVIEMNDSNDSKKRIEAYYNALLQHRNQNEDEHTKKAIEYVIDSMDDEDVVELEDDIIKKDEDYSEIVSSNQEDAFAKRMMAYMTKITELSQVQKELSTPMQEIVDKYKKFDFNLLVKEEINGNEFTYRKDKFPIEQYRQELYELGNKSKGNQWSVSISSDGKLVIY